MKILRLSRLNSHTTSLAGVPSTSSILPIICHTFKSHQRLAAPSSTAGATTSCCPRNASEKSRNSSTGTANFNTAVGNGALFSNTEGDSNVAIGYEALFNNTTGAGNTATGYQALHNNTEGFNIGGPAYIPGKFNRNKDKLFFFVGIEWQGQLVPQGLHNVTVPTAAELGVLEGFIPELVTALLNAAPEDED